MLTQAQVRRFAYDSGVRDLQVVEKEIVLTHLLQLFSEKGFVKVVAFKGGTCIRKTWLGTSGRFSTDLDFTSVVTDQETRCHQILASERCFCAGPMVPKAGKSDEVGLGRSAPARARRRA